MKNSSTCRNRINQGQRLRRVLLAALVGLCFVESAYTLDSNRAMSQYVHDQWGASKGFLGGAVHAICQSADGYLWIGTQRGLVRFDGVTFTLIQRPIADSPPIGPVRGLVSDAEGNLWIRLDGPHLLLYREGRFEDAFARFGLQDITFTAMSRDNKGGVLLWGLSNRPLRYRDGKFETVADAQEVWATVLSVAETRDGRLWMGTRDNGLLRINHGLISSVSRELAGTKVNSLLPATNGGLWIGTDAGIKFWDGHALAKTDLPAAIRKLQILAMTKDHEANVWVGTDHGLIRITPARTVSLDEVNNSSGNQVTAVYEDRDGDLWFGGSRGLERLRDGMFTMFSTGQGLPSANNGAVYVDGEGRTWFAPLSGGLFWLKDQRVGRVTLGGLDADVVYSISGGDGEVWIGRQHGGLTVLTKRGDSFVARTYNQADGLAQQSVYSVHRNRNGTVWAGTVSAGVSRLKDGAFTTFSAANGLPSNAVSSIVEGFDGTMWFATPNGLASFADGHWINRSVPDGLPSSDVRSVFEDSLHVLWIATAGGLALLSAGHIEIPHSLPEPLHEQIFGMAEDNGGSLWIATSDHVLKVNRDRLVTGSLEEADIQSYGIADGLPAVEGVRRDRSVVVDGFGRIWFSLNGGLALADPKLTAETSAPVMVRIESISAEGARVDLNGPLRIASGSKSITFNYAGSNLYAAERVRFRYKLDGSDQGWSNDVASRQVIYTHLAPGSYRFRVVASNGEGLWNGPETGVPFVIAPAFWQTWWFRALCLSAGVLAIIALYRLRMYQLTQRLNVRFHERLAERTRIAQELHDTMLQGFLSARMQLDVAEDQLPDDSPAKPRLQRILQLMGQVTDEGRNTLRGLRTAESNHRNLELAFSRMRQEFAIDEKIGYRVIVQGLTRPVRPLIRDEIYRIGREAVANAFLHARANSIEIEVEYATKYLRILVRDDGGGIDPQVLHAGRDGHWGLPGMRKRSEDIGASVKLRSRVGAGTEVELIVPSAIAFEGQSRGPISQWIPWLNGEKFDSTGGGKKRGNK